MDPTIELLKEMRGRVAVYVGSNSITLLATFLGGFVYALEKYGLAQNAQFLPAFQKMVAARYGVQIPKAWEEIIRFHSSGENEAIDIFWRLFDEFLEGESKQGIRVTP